MVFGTFTVQSVLSPPSLISQLWQLSGFQLGMLIRVVEEAPLCLIWYDQFFNAWPLDEAFKMTQVFSSLVVPSVGVVLEGAVGCGPHGGDGCLLWLSVWLLSDILPPHTHWVK